MLTKRILIASVFIKIASTILWTISMNDVAQCFSIFTILFKLSEIYGKYLDNAADITDFSVFFALTLLWLICPIFLFFKKQKINNIGYFTVIALCLADIIYAIYSITLIFTLFKLFKVISILFSLFIIILVFATRKKIKKTQTNCQLKSN